MYLYYYYYQEDLSQQTDMLKSAGRISKVTSDSNQVKHRRNQQEERQ